MSDSTDFSNLRNSKVLIVGQGLAGTVMAFRLLRAGAKIAVVDRGHTTASSMVAAGLYNPIIFKWITKTWNAQALLAEALKTYGALEQLLNTKLLNDTPLVRIIASAQELQQWERRTTQDDYIHLIAPEDKELAQVWDKGFGNRGINGSGWLDLKAMLTTFRDYLRQNDCLIEQEMDYSEMQQSVQLQFSGREYTHMICCDGANAERNPFFDYVRFRNTKGEVLDVHDGNLGLKRMINHGQFAIPLENGNYRIGTNFDWKDLEPVPTEDVKNQLLEGYLSFFGHKPDSVVQHRAGLRPTSPDRRPYVGPSKHNNRVFMLNGLGSKGVLLAPWCAGQLIENLESGTSIHPEIDVNRPPYEHE